MEQKNMLITGASRGIGAATALLAAAQGYAVALNYLQNKTAADLVVERIRRQGGKAVAIQADVSKEDDILRLFRTVDEEFGRLHCLINNTGILEKQSKLVDLSYERLQKIFSTNITGAFICAREAVKRMAFSRGGLGGTIVNVSSIAAKTGAPNEYTDYAASKAALDALTIGLSKEVAHDGIRLNAVRPGFIYTDIHASGGEPERVNRLKEQIPMKRGGEPREVAEAILWLASDQSSYTTGGFIDIAGGR